MTDQTPPEDHLRWIAARDRSLRDPEGWLALVALHWLPPGETVLAARGTPTDHELVLAGAEAAPAAVFDHGPQGGVTAAPCRGVEATLDGHAIAPGLTVNLADDRAGDASVLRLGRLHVTHIHRQGRAALRIRDREAPTLQRFEGVPRFGFDPALRVVARFEPAASGTTVPVTLITEHVEDHPVAGTLHLEIDGREVELLAEPAGEDLFVVFGDETNRDPGEGGTYGGGRFLKVGRPAPDGSAVVDFNRSVNPPCSFTPYATCPTPPAANRLPFPVRAGERRPH
ncbi:MAG: DUF1684 domain-containing protein [Planctomycetota bacterium]|nr:DUF1684 domain-containing protein [Planctomycetota bacterium]